MLNTIKTLAMIGIFGVSATAQADFRRIMISEVSWAEPEGVEITNHSTSSINLTNWVVLWNDGTIKTSQPLTGSIAPGQTILVTEANPGAIPEAPGTTTILPLLPVLNTNNQPFGVGLRDGNQVIRDEVHVANATGTMAPTMFFSSAWSGVALRHQLSGSVSVERIWGLDSNRGTDWTEESVRSFGLENRNSGTRGQSAGAIANVVINEVDDSPDYVELQNLATSNVNLQNWVILTTSGTTSTRITPFPATTNLAGGARLVIGNTSTVPAELPGGVTYVNLSALGSPQLNLGTNEFDMGLYDAAGYPIDVVRFSRVDRDVVQNHPRVPCYWSDAVGAAGRVSVGSGAVGRRSLAAGATPVDTGSGGDWLACFTRTMGTSNATFASDTSIADILDVRINEGVAPGNGLSFIINAGTSASGFRHSMFYSLGHWEGGGPFFGLGTDALSNWLFVLATPGLSGSLDARGSARIDFPPGVLPSGVDSDNIFILQNPSGQFMRRTAILKFDT